MKYFDGRKYSGTIYHSDWKYALLEYGKGMDASGVDRVYHLKQALQILNNIPDDTSDPVVDSDDVAELQSLIDEIYNQLQSFSVFCL